ncbi:MAG: D-xylose 1-dehydrogenase Gfo6 [Halobacteriaceae archaeon]
MDVDDYFESFSTRDWDSGATGTVRFAMVGLGWWTIDEAMPAIADSDRVEVTALVSGSTEKADRVAAEFGVEHTLTYEQFHAGEAADAYDAVYVCTPNATHLEHVTAAAELGKDVLCEKPMEASVDRAERLVAAAEDAGVTLMVAYRMHTEPAVRRMRELVADGFVGDPLLVQGNFSQHILELVRDPDQWRLNPDFAGPGASVTDIGIYPLNTARYVLDADPVAVTAQMTSESEGFEDVPDERAAFTLTYEGGVQAAMTTSQNASRTGHLELVGSEGHLRLEPAYYMADRRTLTVSRNEFETRVAVPPADQMREEFDYFADCLLDGRDPYADGDHGLVDMRAIEAVFEAAESGRAVSVGRD